MLRDLLHTCLVESYSDEISLDDFDMSIPPEGYQGDISIPCFSLQKKLNIPVNQIAEHLANRLAHNTHIQQAVAFGPFVNIHFSTSWYIQVINRFQIPHHEPRGETVVVDYMGTNIGKPAHIGHLCTPAFGQPIANLMRYLGYTVICDMHQGDWGGIFGKLIVAWQRFGDSEAFKNDPVDHLFQIYVRITKATEQEPDLEQQFRDAFRKLSDGDPEYLKMWQTFTADSLSRVREIMERFLIFPDVYIGEAFYEGLDLPKLGDWPDLRIPDQTMAYIVEELIRVGVATRNDDGSVGIAFASETKIPSCILQKRDGTHGYLASDLAAIKYRMEHWRPAKIVYFVDNRQSLHFRQLFASARGAWGLGDTELKHVANGFVTLEDGAMSTRSGRIIPLQDVVDESFSRVQEILISKQRSLTDADREAIALGAIKYSFLAQDLDRDWVFTWDRVLSFEGNSGPYVQYAIVRLRKLLHNFERPTHIATDISVTEHDRRILRDILMYTDQLDHIARTYKCHGLIQYCFELANHINSFYANTSKLTQEKDVHVRSFRVSLLYHALDVFEHAFAILGLPIPQQM